MKSNWPTKKLSDLLDTCDAGVWGKPAIKGKGLFVLRSTNMTNDGHLNFSDVAERKVEGDIKKVKLLNGDILVEKSGGGPDQPVGRVAYFVAPDGQPYSFANFIQRLRVKSDLIDSRFLFYRLLFLHKIGFTKKLQSQTTGIRNLKLSLYLKTEIPTPPLNIQKQIVERLDKIAKAQKLNDDLIQKADELYRSLLYNELNTKFKNQNAKSQFKIKKLGEVADYINGRAFKPTEWSSSGLPIIRIQNLTETQEKFNYFNGKVEDKYLVKDGDILLSWSASLGVYVWNKGDAVLNQHIFKVVPHSDINKDYLFHALVTAVEELKRRVHGSTMTHVTKPVFNRVTIGVPPLETQKQIVAKLSAAQEYKIQLLGQKSKLKELFDSVLAKSFRQ